MARDKISSLSDTGSDEHSLDSVLADLGDIMTADGGHSLTVDTIRFNSDGFDCTGTAPDMTAVLNFRRAWEDKAKLVQVDNTQFVSGIGYRFDIRIRW